MNDLSFLLKPSSTHPGRTDWERTEKAIREYFDRLYCKCEISNTEYEESVRVIPSTIAYLKRRKHYLNKKRKQGKLK